MTRRSRGSRRGRRPGFILIADDPQGEGKRWVLVAPPGTGDNAATILLARASTPEQEAIIGNQAGGRVFLFLRTDDFDRDYTAYLARGVNFVRPPVTHAIAEIVPGASSGHEPRRHKTSPSPCSRISTAISGT